MKRALPEVVSMVESAWKSCKRSRKGTGDYDSDSELSLVNYPFSSNHYIPLEDLIQEEIKEFYYDRPERLVLYLAIQWENVTALEHDRSYYHFSLVHGKKKESLSIQQVGFLQTSQFCGDRLYHNQQKYVQSCHDGELLRLELEKRNLFIDYGLQGSGPMICKWFLNWNPPGSFYKDNINPLFCRIQTIGNVDFNKENWFDRWFLVQEIANQGFLPKDIGKLFAKSICNLIPTYSIRSRPFDWNGSGKMKYHNIEINQGVCLNEGGEEDNF